MKRLNEKELEGLEIQVKALRDLREKYPDSDLSLLISEDLIIWFRSSVKTGIGIDICSILSHITAERDDLKQKLGHTRQSLDDYNNILARREEQITDLLARIDKPGETKKLEAEECQDLSEKVGELRGELDARGQHIQGLNQFIKDEWKSSLFQQDRIRHLEDSLIDTTKRLVQANSKLSLLVIEATRCWSQEEQVDPEFIRATCHKKV